ncbi:MAG: hypothetical protein ABJK37_12905 [Paraglaciecola sp.]|uniref:hypothetical protein n=1 Tax=Paraglaciecola sp. TaxID=1920173 RepID=UPI00329A10F9
MRKLTIPTLLLTLMSATSIATTPSYSFFQASTVKTELAELEQFNPSGFSIKISSQWGNNLFTEFKYIDTDDTKSNLTLETLQRQFSLGYFHSISANTTLDYRIGYGNFKTTGISTSESNSAKTDYYSLATNLRFQASSDLEIYAGFEAQNWEGDADQKAYRLGALYDLWGFLAGVEYTKFSDQEVLEVGVRYAF